MTTQLIELKKHHGSHKTGDRVYATKAEIEQAKLKAGEDYVPLGTAPGPMKSTLNEKPAEGNTPIGK